MSLQGSMAKLQASAQLQSKRLETIQKVSPTPKIKKEATTVQSGGKVNKMRISPSDPNMYK